MRGARLWSLFGELDPTAATKILQAAVKIPSAATKIWCSQKKKKNKKTKTAQGLCLI